MIDTWSIEDGMQEKLTKWHPPYMLRYVSATHILLLIKHLYLIDAWLDEDQKNKHHKRHMFQRDWTISPFLVTYSTLNGEHNWVGGPMYPINESTHKQFR